MRPQLKYLLPAFAAAFLLSFIIACQSTPVAQTPMPNAYKRAVVVSAGNGGPVTVYLPSDDGKSVYALTGEGGRECADCKDAASKYFQTGTLDPKCPTCTGTRQAVTFSEMGHN